MSSGFILSLDPAGTSGETLRTRGPTWQGKQCQGSSVRILLGNICLLLPLGYCSRPSSAFQKPQNREFTGAYRKEVLLYADPTSRMLGCHSLSGNGEPGDHPTSPWSPLFPKLGHTDAIKMHNYQVFLMGQLLSLAKVFMPHNSLGRPVLFNEMLLLPGPSIPWWQEVWGNSFPTPSPVWGGSLCILQESPPAPRRS